MAKLFATFSGTDGKWTLEAGPDGDYQKHRKIIMDARSKGTGKADELRMVDLKAGTVKRAVKLQANRGEVRAAREEYRESLTVDKSPAATEPAKPAKAKPSKDS